LFVLAKKEGELIVKKRPQIACRAEDYPPCHKCFGYYSKEEFSRHDCVSEQETFDEKSVKNGMVMMYSAISDHQHPRLQDILSGFLNDEVGAVVREDTTILKYMANMLVKMRETDKESVLREKARVLGSFIIYFRNKVPGISLKEMLLPS
jgi:hypothetical protein